MLRSHISSALYTLFPDGSMVKPMPPHAVYLQSACNVRQKYPLTMASKKKYTQTSEWEGKESHAHLHVRETVVGAGGPKQAVVAAARRAADEAVQRRGAGRLAVPDPLDTPRAGVFPRVRFAAVVQLKAVHPRRPVPAVCAGTKVGTKRPLSGVWKRGSKTRSHSQRRAPKPPSTTHWLIFVISTWYSRVLSRPCAIVMSSRPLGMVRRL